MISINSDKVAMLAVTPEAKLRIYDAAAQSTFMTIGQAVTKDTYGRVCQDATGQIAVMAREEIDRGIDYSSTYLNNH